MAPEGPGKPPLALVVVLVLGAVGLAVIILAVIDSTSWPLLIAGVLAVLIALPVAWAMVNARDKNLL